MFFVPRHSVQRKLIQRRLQHAFREVWKTLLYAYVSLHPCCLFLVYLSYPLQSERVSKETNAWLFVAAQHPNASGQFIHYTSPRLRREAKDNTKEIVQQFHTTVNSLMNARRKDALEMGRALEISRHELAQKEDEVCKQVDEIHEKDALLAKYKDMLGIDKQ